MLSKVWKIWKKKVAQLHSSPHFLFSLQMGVIWEPERLSYGDLGDGVLLERPWL